MPRLPLDHLSGASFDVVVVGAGAVGCASARELAARGFRTLLVDRGDIGAGTSSRSSRLLYSGVGYLAPRFPLWQIPFRPRQMVERFLYARNIMHCRAELVADLPHRLVRRPFYYPFREGDRYPHWLVDFGFRLMDAVAARGVPLAYRRLSASAAAEESGLVSALGGPLASVATFEEFMYDWPERICVDTALDAERRGATLRTYTKVSRIERRGGVWAVTLDEAEPERTGQAVVTAPAVVNAAGPWVDRIAGGGGGNLPRIVGRKGVNVMARLPEAWRGQGLEAFSSKGEPFYVFPWGEHHFVGPTEADVTDDPDDVHVLEAEIDYILGETNLLFTGLGLTRRDVLHCWCGVRPMSTLDGGTVSLPVRAVENPAMPGLITMTGSYIMMHRHAGRLAAQSVERHLGRRGAPAQGMLAITSEASGDDDIARMVAGEHVVRLGDLVRRRLRDGLDPTLGRASADRLSRIAAAALGWSETRRQDELAQFEAETARVYHQPDPTFAQGQFD